MRSRRTSCASQILSNIVFSICSLLGGPQTGRHDGEETRLAAAAVLEMVGEIGVEGDRVSLRERVPLVVDHNGEAAAENDDGLAAAGSMDGAVAGPAGSRLRLEDVLGDRRSFTWGGARE